MPVCVDIVQSWASCSCLPANHSVRLPRTRIRCTRARQTWYPTRTYRSLCTGCIVCRGHEQSTSMPLYTPPTLKAFAWATCLTYKIHINDDERYYSLSHRFRFRLLGRCTCDGALALFGGPQYVPLVYQDGALHRQFWWCPKFSSITGKPYRPKLCNLYKHL